MGPETGSILFFRANTEEFSHFCQTRFPSSYPGTEQKRNMSESKWVFLPGVNVPPFPTVYKNDMIHFISPRQTDQAPTCLSLATCTNIPQLGSPQIDLHSQALNHPRATFQVMRKCMTQTPKGGAGRFAGLQSVDTVYQGCQHTVACITFHEDLMGIPKNEMGRLVNVIASGGATNEEREPEVTRKQTSEGRCHSLSADVPILVEWHRDYRRTRPSAPEN